MALFGSTNACVGIDVGTSSLKIVELINRRRRIEVTTYAQADVPNLLINPNVADDEAVPVIAEALSRMLDQAQTSSDTVIAALPSSIVFSAVITMPPLPEGEMEKAVRFAARDVVPADLNEMILGYSRLGEQPHMEGASHQVPAGMAAGGNNQLEPIKVNANGKLNEGPVPVFITAAPQYVVGRYTKVMDKLGLRLLALEVETFPLVRSLLSNTSRSALIVDIGDLATTFHLIDAGIPRVSHTIEYGGHAITEDIARALSTDWQQAENLKKQYGLLETPMLAEHQATEQAVQAIIKKARYLLEAYQRNSQRIVNRSVLIGGGANLLGLRDYWAQSMRHETVVGNPWRGLAYPQQLENRLALLGPTYGVAVGLALRGFMQ